MEHNYNSIRHFHNWRNYRRSRSYSDKPFFIDPEKDRRSKKEKHHSDIIDVYREWQNMDFGLNIDLFTYDPNQLRINIVGRLLPDLHDEKKPRTNEERALEHIKAYPEVFEKYVEILNLQKKFNIEMDGFINDIIDHLRNLVTPSDNMNSDIRWLLRYYLYVIVDINLHPDILEFRLERLTPINYEPLSVTNSIKPVKLTNPFSNDSETISLDIRSNHQRIYSSIRDFCIELRNMAILIKEFLKLLDTITADEVVGIMGKCPIEERLSPKGRIKTFFHIN